MFNKLTCKDFILRYEAWVNAIRASSFIVNFPQISAKPIAFQRNLLGKLSRNRPFFTNRFTAKLASKIPAKLPRNRPFFPRNLTFSSATYQKPWKGHLDLTDSYEICPKCSLVINAQSVSGFFDFPNTSSFTRSHVTKIRGTRRRCSAKYLFRSGGCKLIIAADFSLEFPTFSSISSRAGWIFQKTERDWKNTSVGTSCKRHFVKTAG